MKQIYTLLFILTGFSLTAQNGWQDITPGNISGEISAIVFLDANTGLVTNGDIYKTSDGGATWTNVNAPGSYIFDFHFLDSQTGFASGDHGTILKTTDGGDTWTECVSGMTTPLREIFFPNTNVGYTVENYGDVLKTIDGGSTWSSFSTPQNALRSLWFTDNDNGVISTFGGIYKTSDGGSSWSYTGTMFSGTQFFFSNTTTGYMAGYSDGYFKTTNGGSNWTWIVVPEANGKKINHIEFLDAAHALAVGNTGLLLYSSDSANTWTATSGVTGSDMMTLCYINENLAFAAGRDGTVVKFTGNSGIGKVIPKELHFSINCYPNPVKTTTTVEYVLEKDGHAKIDIHNILGERIATLTDRKQGKGVHQIVYDASQLPEGVYFYSLNTDDISLTGRLIVKK
ncbi:MAG: T9SS type A sorting domain-containing protein [Bacteroidetes bacterium]|nr:T9SS type A sorting domain-containing protein [Bacteroidota bacterium]